MNKIRKGDEVILNTGKDKGKRGTVLQILDTGHVVVEGANLVKNMPSPTQCVVWLAVSSAKRCLLISLMLHCLILPPKRVIVLASKR